MHRYESYLLCDSGRKLDGDPMVNLMTRLGYTIPRKDLSPKLTLMMWVDDRGQPFLGAEKETDAEEFVKKARGGTLRGFSLLPTRDIEKFVMGRVSYRGNSWEFVRDSGDDPYSNQFLEISDVSTRAVTPDFQDPGRIPKGTILVGDIPNSAMPIMFDPVHVRIRGDHELRELADLSGLDASCVCLLPPFRSGFSRTSYFTSEARGLRSALMDLIESFGGSESGAATLVRLQDLPILRDFVMEGAELDVTTDSLVTAVRLRINKNTNPLATYRRHFLRKKTSPPNKLSVSVAGVIREYIDSIVDSVVFSSDPATRSDLVLTRRKIASRTKSRVGSWDLLNRIHLKLNQREQMQQFQSLVLSGNENADEGYWNHAGAEDDFLSWCWRFGGSGQLSSRSWREASLNLLLCWAEGQSFDSESHFANQSLAWPRVESRADGALKFTYSSNSEDAAKKVAMWKYLLPQGTAIVAGGLITLDDDVSRLDQGFEMA